MASFFAVIFSWQASAEDLQFIDAHSPVPASVRMASVLSLMDRAGVTRAFVASFDDPQARMSREARQKHRKELRDYAKKFPDRITPTIGLKGTGNRDGDPHALELIQQQATSPLFGAQAEVLVVHAEKGPTLPEVVVDLDHRSVQEARAIALNRGWPLIIHIEFGHARTLGRYDHYMGGLEALLTENATLPVILSHMGQLKPAEVSRLIAAHDNIYFLTSNSNPIVLAAKGKNLPWTNLFSSGAIAKEWAALMVAHPDRFIFAIDAAIKPDWSDRYVQQVELWRKALQQLPTPVAYAIARGNAERLWRLPGGAEPGPATPPPGGAGTAAGGGELVGPRGLTAQQVISNSDRDGDGKVARDEFQGSPRNFENLDANHDGFVTREEFEARWRARQTQ